MPNNGYTQNLSYNVPDVLTTSLFNLVVECFLFPLFFNKGCRVYKYLPLRPFSELDFWTKLCINYVKVDHDKLLITSIRGIVVCVLLILLIKNLLNLC